MPAFKTAITQPENAARRLADFGLTCAQFLAIRDAARAAADDASPLMPQNAPGTLAYIFGVEAMRGQLLDVDWQMDRTLGVEAVINHTLGIRVIYQNVDQACDPIFKPMPRSGKGSASERMCYFPLFEHYGMTLDADEDRLPRDETVDPYGDAMATYFAMVGEDGSVEFSCPIIRKKRFADFRERIFIDRAGDDWDSHIEPSGDPAEDFDVAVTFKDVA